MPNSKTIRKTFDSISAKAIDDGSLIVTISTSNPDRSNDVVDPQGADLTSYLKNPVVALNHNYQGLPIAKTEQIEVKEDRIMAKVVFPKRGVYPLADTVHDLYQDGFMNAWSIGFIPKEFEPNDQGGKDFTKWELLEYSAVLVPDNPEALTMLRSKGFDVDGKGEIKTIREIKSEVKRIDEETKDVEKVETKEDQKVIEKGVIPYKKYPLADQGEGWDGPREIASADVESLKEMSAWFDGDNPEVKSSYKLPHHRASDTYTVWRGVVSAMGALLGARGGVDVPLNDRQGIYTHLSKHYADFDQTPPDFKVYSEAELKEMFEEKEEVKEEEKFVVDIKTKELIKGMVEDMKSLVERLENLTVAEKKTVKEDETNMVIDLVQALKVADKTIGIALRNHRIKKSNDLGS